MFSFIKWNQMMQKKEQRDDDDSGLYSSQLLSKESLRKSSVSECRNLLPIKKNRPACHSNFNDIDIDIDIENDIENDIKYSVPDDRMKKFDKASKCNALEKQKGIKQPKTISCNQRFVACEQNLGEVYYDNNISIIEDETPLVDNTNRIRTSRRERKSSFNNKYVHNISITDDEVELSETSYKDNLNTVEVKRSTKKPRIINTINGMDHY
ncbi:hypothetical protein M0802_013516 [Mischocyttarus mexicanus]|nr:hypothetical protein M0802_013516 [Mischocyttarus mexicanus]